MIFIYFIEDNTRHNIIKDIWARDVTLLHIEIVGEDK